MSIGSLSVRHIAFIVRDIEKTLANWSAILGIPAPAVRYLPKYENVPTYTDGMPGDYSDVKIAVFTLDNIKLEFVQPGSKPSPWKDYLDKNGEGFQHVAFVVPDRAVADASLKEIGAPPPYHIGYYPNGTYSFADTKNLLAAEINIKTDEDNTARINKLLGK